MTRNMDIDEAIAHERQKAKDNRNEFYTFGVQKCKQCAEEHEQRAEWLEELKELRNITSGHLYAVAFNRGYLKAENDYHAQSEKDRQSSYDCGYELGYSKAIDDFKEELFKNSERVRPVGWLGHSEIVTCKKIYEIAEELKESEAECL